MHGAFSKIVLASFSKHMSFSEIDLEDKNPARL